MTWTAGDGPGRDLLAPPAARPPAIPPAVTRKHRARGLVFVLLLAAAFVVGAAVMGFVLLAAGRPDAVAIGFFLAALPVGPLVACYLWLDRYEPEPVRWLVVSFLWGALVATAGALIVQTASSFLADTDVVVSAVVMAPITEEAGKGLLVLLLVWSRRHVVDGVLDGLVYAGLVGIGFAFTENILYFAGAYTGGPDLGPGGLGAATGLFVLRGVFSPFAHPLFTSAIGIGVGLMVGARSRATRIIAPVAGYVVAVALHAAWNGSAFIGGGSFFVMTYVFAMVPGFLAVLGFALWARHREGAMLARAFTDLSRLGYVHSAEVPHLVGLRARRSVRRAAAQRGGKATERLVREYHQQAVELATLHRRVMMGTAPADAMHRGTLMAQRLGALRSEAGAWVTGVGPAALEGGRR